MKYMIYIYNLYMENMIIFTKYESYFILFILTRFVQIFYIFFW